MICAELALNVPVETLSRPLTFHVPAPALRIGRPVPPCEYAILVTVTLGLLIEASNVALPED